MNINLLNNINEDLDTTEKYETDELFDPYNKKKEKRFRNGKKRLEIQNRINKIKRINFTNNNIEYNNINYNNNIEK